MKISQIIAFLLISFTFNCQEDCDECVAELLQTRRVSYVCGDNGITFLTECFADCNDVRVEFEGQCPRHYCPSIYEPVCTELGNTYLNECEAQFKGEPIAYNGECRGQHRDNIDRRTRAVYRVVRPSQPYAWP